MLPRTYSPSRQETMIAGAEGAGTWTVNEVIHIEIPTLYIYLFKNPSETSDT